MQTNLEKARALMEQESYTCVLCKADQVYTSRTRGVRQLVDWLDAGENLRYYAAADRVVGKAAAMLYCLMGVKEVYAPVMTRAAARLLIGHGIAVSWGAQVEAVENRSHTGLCPMEQTVWDIEDPREGLAAIREKLRQLGA